MIADSVTRRSVVIGGLLGTASLSGCSFSELTTRKIQDQQAADRARIAQARDLSMALQRDIDATQPVGTDALGAAIDRLAPLLGTQISQLAQVAGLGSPRPSALGPARALTSASLRRREQDLARDLRGLALGAVSGQVAALLASAAAGIDQVLAG